MIVTLFLNFAALFLSGLLDLLPTGHLPVQVGEAVSYFVGIVNQFSYVLPVATLFQAFALVISVDIAIVLWHFINWIIRKIPGLH